MNFKKAIIVDTVINKEYITQEVLEDIHKVWTDYEYGNDHYYYEIDLEYFYEDNIEQYPNLYKWVEETFKEEIESGFSILIHYWW